MVIMWNALHQWDKRYLIITVTLCVAYWKMWGYIVMDNTLKFERKENYGELRFYPACEKSKFLADLCRRKIFYRYQVLDIRDKLGYTIEITNTTL